MSTFDEVLAQVVELLQREGRVSYRALKIRFNLDDEYIEGLKDELIVAKRLAVDEANKVLVWEGRIPVASSQLSVVSPHPPVSYTPKHLTERILAEQAAMEARGATDGERKTITALFADIKGSMDLIEDLDPEEARRLIDPALQLMMDAVHRYEGYVVQSTGDGIFALFGAPIAHEDHAQRALYAALRMQEETKHYADRLRLQGQRPLEIRVGVNTGEVVVRSIRKDDLHTEYTPIGHSTSLAARLQSLATGGGIVVSEPTYRLTEGYFACRVLGTAQIKGVSEPVPIYEVLGVGPLRTRLQVAARRGLVRFVGRQAELEQMQKALALTKAGHGQIVGVMGEPGVGKSRLFHEFKLLSQKEWLVLETFSVSHGKAYAYLPLIELLKNYFQLTPQDDERKRREKVGGKVLMLDRSLEDTLPYLFALLGIAESNSALQQMDPQIRRKRTLDAIKRLLIRETLNQPLIVIFEDLHWVDTETQAFLSLLSENVATARILLLVNYRPEYRHEWGNKTYYTQLRLDPLGKEEAQEMLTVLLGDSPALQSLKQFVLAKTEGNPFFMEEIVQDLFERGVLVRDPVIGVKQASPTSPDRASPTPTDLHIPSTVQGVLASRIDRLAAEEKELLQTLAVIGKEFSLSLLEQVVDKPAEQLHGLLARLQAGEFIYEQPAFPEPEYVFKHALTQEVAYNSLLLERRRVLHERTAQAIEKLFHSRLEDYYSELAHHYSRSGNTQKAVEYLRLAGQQAGERSAYAEAITHLTAALELLKTLPDTLERSQQELALQTALAPMVAYNRGFAVPEVEQIYTRAYELCRQVGNNPQLFPVVLGLRTFYHLQGKPRTACELAEQLLTLAQQTQDPAFLVLAHRALGATLFTLGDLVLARTHLEQSIALYDSQRHRSDSVLYGQDPGVLGRGYLAWTLWHLGYPDQAQERGREVLMVAQELSRPTSRATALANVVCLHLYRREREIVRERAEGAIILSIEQAIPTWVAVGTYARGWALAQQGKIAEGIAEMQQGLAAYQATGTELQRSFYLALLAETYETAGRIEEGLSTLAEALAIVDKGGECFYEAEIYRLKGEFSLQQEVRGWGRETRPPSPQASGLKPQALQAVAQEAEGYFLKAVEIARRQHAKSLELRAAMSLSRLWQSQDKKDEARQMLAEIYGWFTEGFDTADLRDAKTLLDELGAAHAHV